MSDNIFDDIMGLQTRAKGTDYDEMHELKKKIKNKKDLNNDDDSPNKKEGSLTQYAYMEGLYLPTTNTIKELPSSCFKATFLQNGQLAFEQIDFDTDDLIELPDSKSDDVLTEIETFWKKEDVYKRYGYVFKRGILLYGPPGTGKTATVSMVIKKMLDKDGIVLFAGNPMAVAIAVQRIRSIEGNRPILVIWEDFEEIVSKYGEAELLSLLDGELQLNNVVYLATTNYPEKLDGRITNRPSRFDRVIYIDYPNDAARELYLKAKVGTIEKNGFNLVKETKGMSFAHLKEVIICLFIQEKEVKDTLVRIKNMMKNTANSDEYNGKSVGFFS